MSRNPIKDSIQHINQESGQSRYEAWILAAARAGYTDSTPIEDEPSAVMKEYQWLVHGCQAGATIGEKTYSGAEFRNLVSDRIHHIEQSKKKLARSNQFRQLYQNHQFAQEMTPEFKQVLLRVFEIEFSSPRHQNTVATTSEKTSYNIIGISSEAFWAGALALSSAASSYFFAQQYYQENGLGLDIIRNQKLRDIIAHFGGLISFAVFSTLLYNFDLKRIQSMVMQFNISDAKSQLKRKLRTLFFVEKTHVFQRRYPGLLIWVLAVMNLFTTINSPYLSYVHVSIPYLRGLSMLGSFFSALLGNNYVIEKAFALPLSELYHRYVKDTWTAQSPEADLAKMTPQAYADRDQLNSQLAQARQALEHAHLDTLAGTLQRVLTKPITHTDLLPLFLRLGITKSIDTPVDLTTTLWEAYLPKIGRTGLLFASAYAMSTCIRQGRDAVAAILHQLNSSLNPSLVILLGTITGFASLAINLVIGYYALIYVLDLIQTRSDTNHLEENTWRSRLNFIFLAIISAANTIPSYQISVDHPEWPGGSSLLALVAFCTSIYSINGFFADRASQQFDLVSTLNKVYHNDDLSHFELQLLRKELLKELDRHQAIIRHTDDEMVTFYRHESPHVQFNLDSLN